MENGGNLLGFFIQVLRLLIVLVLLRVIFGQVVGRRRRDGSYMCLVLFCFEVVVVESQLVYGGFCCLLGFRRRFQFLMYREVCDVWSLEYFRSLEWKKVLYKVCGKILFYTGTDVFFTVVGFGVNVVSEQKFLFVKKIKYFILYNFEWDNLRVFLIIYICCLDI